MGVAVVRAALAAALIAAAVATGSASVLAAGLLMLVLAVREATVLVGRQRAQRPPDARHPVRAPPPGRRSSPRVAIAPPVARLVNVPQVHHLLALARREP